MSIVFIHGLRGHPRDTWTHHASWTSVSNLRRIKRKDNAGVYWPFDLLPKDFAEARILTYGYDSHLIGGFSGVANRCGISDHGQDLLAALEDIRRADPQRPLIFIAHSLGGLVVKEVGLPSSCLVRINSPSGSSQSP